MGSFDVINEIVGKAKGNESLGRELAGFNKKFLIKPSDASPFYIEIQDGKISLNQGETEGASATVMATDQMLVDIFTGKADGVKAFMSGQLKVSGDIFSAQKLTSLMAKFR